jgi:ubiquinone/menaquinone biosynthesis C-methylase UbiE
MGEDGLDPTKRFSARVADYVRYRPGYPPAVGEMFRREIGLTPEWTVADVGSGTGISSEMFLENGNAVYAVEPNADMRAAAEQSLSKYPNFHSVDGTAEATTLPDGSVDLIVCAQAFHWFNKAVAAAEFARVARPGAAVAVVFNDRKTETSPLLAGYDRLLRAHGTDYKQVSRTTATVEQLGALFGTAFQRRAFPNAQTFDFEGLRGRALSASYVPLPGRPGHDEILRGLRELFDAHQRDGGVTFDYETEVFFGRLPKPQAAP